MRRTISIIPLINIVFLLLLFFMAAGSLKSEKKDEELDLIQSKQPLSPKEKKKFALVVKKNGTLLLNDEIVSAEELKRHLKKVKHLAIYVDEEARASLWLGLLADFEGEAVLMVKNKRETP